MAPALKVTEFRPEHANKLNFYPSLLNEQVRKPHEQPSISSISCQPKQRTVVEFALRDLSKPIGVATDTLTDTLPAELRPSSLAMRSWCAALMPWRRHGGGRGWVNYVPVGRLARLG